MTKITEKDIMKNPMNVPEKMVDLFLEAMGTTSKDGLLNSKQIAHYIANHKKADKWTKLINEKRSVLKNIEEIDYLRKVINELRKKIGNDDLFKYDTLKRLCQYEEKLVQALMSTNIFKVEASELNETSQAYDIAVQKLATQYKELSKDKMKTITTASELKSPTAEELYKDMKEDFNALLNNILGSDIFEKIAERAKPIREKHNRISSIRNKYYDRNNKTDKVLNELLSTTMNELMTLKNVYGNSDKKIRLELAEKLLQQSNKLLNIQNFLKESFPLESDLNTIMGYKLAGTMSKKYNKAAAYFQRDIIVTFAARNGRPVAYIKGLNQYTFYRTQKPKFVKIGNDYVNMINPMYLDDFLSLNKIDDEEIYVSEDSLEQFYGFEGNLSCNLTKKFINTWANYDYPDLKRYTPNKYLNTNMLGMPLTIFTNTLIEISWQNSYYDPEMTEEEINTIIKHLDYPEGRITKELKNLLISRKVDKDKAKEIETFLKEYDSSIQKIFDTNKELAWNALKETYPDRYSECNGKKCFNDNFGLDCGFIYFKTKDEEYNVKREILRNSGKSSEYCSADMNIKLPIFFQSTTAQRIIADVLVKEVKKQLGYEISYYTILD